ncbi:MAG: InlB B-repeat-containing protein [Clostridia bacterium]|nr:InlB B-repeat-containing protein [Clostridia bacterium]
MIAFRKITTLLLAAVLLIAAFTLGTAAAEGVMVDIVSFSRGAQEDLRSSELLEAEVKGYDGNVRELTYEWTSTIGTYLYVYNNHNMYGINNTDGEIEIYNSDKGLRGSQNMAGRTYDGTFKGAGYAWSAIYGANISGEDLEGVITVNVYDKDGELLATASHEGTRERTGSNFFWGTYVNHGFVESNLSEDVGYVRFGLFEGDTKNVKILLGESSIVHITCAECSISNPKVTKGEGIIEFEVDTETNEWYIKSVMGTSYGDAKVEITIAKGNCKFHQRVSATREIEVFVYKKPTTTSTATAIMLDNLDKNCTYFIGGVEGEKQTVDGKVYVVFENLTPNTQYQVEVVGQAANTEPVYAYVYETTKPAHVGTVNVLLDGTYDIATGTATGTLVNIEEMMPEVETLYLRYEDSEIYFPLDNVSTGVYTSDLSDGNYTLYYSVNDSDEKVKLGNQILTINGASRTRDVFFNSVNYDENGGVPEVASEYYLTNSEATVSDVVPEKEGYLFTHWTCEDGHVHKAGDVLTKNIAKQYNLVAQYIDANDVYVDIIIEHTADDGFSINGSDDIHNVNFTVDQRFEGSGDYTEVVAHSVAWDGKGTYTGDYFTATVDNNTTKYTAKAPVLVNVAKYAEYTLTSNKSGYDLVSVTSELDENGDWRITATLKFYPNDFDIRFAVELDKEAKMVSNEIRPVAVNVKVTTWSNPVDVDGDETMWWHISQHKDSYLRVALDENGYGEGTYPVWMSATDTKAPYAYRLEVVSFEIAGGTAFPARDKLGTNEVYSTEFDRYSAKVIVDGGNVPSSETTLAGVYYDADTSAQVGTLKAVVSIDVYDVTFVPSGGELLGTTDNTVVNYQTEIPNLDNYVPTREGGYVFDGWYVADANGDMTAEQPVSGTVLYNDITLVAKWRAPLTIKGHVAVAGTYSIIEDGMPVIHEIQKYDRLNTVYVFLQRINPNGYAETVKYIEAPVMSTLFEGDHGIANYEFTGIEDYGDRYRIKVTAADYHSLYNNDTSSIPVESFYDYVDESRDDLYLAEFLDDADVNVANVYAFLYFDPQNFILEYQVDSSLVGDGFAPDNAEVLVLYDTGDRIDPQSWSPISQMVYAGNLIGNDSAFVNDIANGSYPVWMSQSGTGAAYDYSIRVKSLTFDGEKTEYDNSLPYYLVYNGSARYSDVSGKQTQPLTATIYPRMYTLTFDMGNLPEDVWVNGMDKYATTNSTFEDSFYWSFGTEITAAPKADGYIFLGWFDEDGNKVSVIPADTAEDVTITAKWTTNVEFDVMADAGYYAESRNAAEKVGTIAFNARVKDIDEAKKVISTFGIYVYDLTGSTVKITAAKADMEQLVKDNGEFHIIIDGISLDNFDKNVMAAPYVVVNGEIIIGESMNITVSQSQKWLGAKTAE